MKYRRFGRTGFQMPVFSCGGMRFQQSWKGGDPVTPESQHNLEACVRTAFDLGITHFETARGYGTSEAQLGKILPQLPRTEILVQTKVAPMKDMKKFVATFEKSIGLLGVDYLDLFSFHGINNEDCFESTLRCLETVLRWKDQGRIRAIGFSTHGAPDFINTVVQSGHFDYFNLHWYYIYQNNWAAIESAAALDMGVFIISPNDKGGMLYKPSRKLLRLTEPLHPMVFNALFCLSRPQVHTLSCGVARPTDFSLHMETIPLLEEAGPLIQPIVERLEQEMMDTLGADWFLNWEDGLPEWYETPGEINVPWILRLRNLALAYDMVDYARMRYKMLGAGDHWFPGAQAGAVDEHDLAPCLSRSSFASVIPDLLRHAHEWFGGKAGKRLVEEEV